MYMRPGQLFKNYTLETKTGGVGSRGRTTSEYAPAVPAVTIEGVLADATPDEKERWKQLQHPITHTLVQQGAPKGKEQDRLVRDGRHFYIQGIENPGDMDLWTLYRVEERRDD